MSAIKILLMLRYNASNNHVRYSDLQPMYSISLSNSDITNVPFHNRIKDVQLAFPIPRTGTPIFANSGLITFSGFSAMFVKVAFSRLKRCHQDVCQFVAQLEIASLTMVEMDGEGVRVYVVDRDARGRVCGSGSDVI